MDFTKLSDDQLDEYIKRAQEDTSNMRLLGDAAREGLVTEDELYAALGPRALPPELRTDTARPFFGDYDIDKRYPIDEDRSSRDMKSLVNIAVDRGTALRAGGDAPGTLIALQSAWQALVNVSGGLAQTLTGIGAEPARAFGIRMGAEMGGNALLDPRARQTRFDEARGNLAALLGLPKDPIARSLYFERAPRSARVIGDLSSIALMISGPGVGGRAGAVESWLPRALTRMGARETAATTAEILSRTAASRGPALAALAAAGTGAGLGYLTAVEGDEGPEATREALSFGAGAYLIASVLTGRPAGAVGRAIFAGERAGRLGIGERLGLALTLSPRLTVGYMTGLGIQGAALASMQAVTDGASPTKAIQTGLEEGMSWIGSDIALARVGGATRWAGLMDKRIAVRGAQWLQDLGIIAEPTMPAAATLLAQPRVASTLLGAGGGAGLATLLGASPGMGAAMGAGAGLARGWALRRLGTILPSDIFAKLSTRGLDALDARETGEVTAAVARGLVDDAALHDIDNDAEALVAKEAAGRLGTTLNEFRVARQIQRLTDELTRIMPDEELPSDPAALKAVLELSGQVLALRERYAQMLDERSEVFAAKDILITPNGNEIPWLRRVRERAETEEQIRAAFADREFEKRIATNVQAMHEEITAREAARASGEQALVDQTAAQDAQSALALTEALKARRNLNITAARTAVENELTPEEMWRELAIARGERPTATKRVFGRDISAAMDDLAARRAARGRPFERLTERAPVYGGTTAEINATLDRYFAEQDAYDALLHLDESTLTVDAAKEGLARIGGKLRQEGNEFVVRTPFAGELRGTWLRDVLTRARAATRDVVPMLGVVPGFVLLGPRDDPRSEPSWLPTAAAAASIAALGITIHAWKGGIKFPFRLGAFARQAVELLSRSSTKLNRETLIALREDGSVRIVAGTSERISGEQLKRALTLSNDNLSALSFSLHNHPPLPQLSAVKAHEDLVTSYPSNNDLDTLWALRVPGSDAAHGVVLSPHGAPTWFTITKPVNKRAFLDSFYTYIFGDPKAFASDANYVKAITALAAKTPLDRVQRELDALYLSHGVIIEHNVPVATLEKRIANFIARTRQMREHPPTIGTDGAETSVSNPLTGPTAERFTDPIEARRIRNELSSTTRDLSVTPAGELKNRRGEVVTRYFTADYAMPITGERAGTRVTEDVLHKNGIPIPGADAAALTAAADVHIPRADADAAARVSPAGAGRVARMLPASVTPQAVTQAPLSATEIVTWGAKHGLDITRELVSGQHVFTARLAGGSEALASDVTLKGMLGQLAVAARALRTGEAGRTQTDLLAGTTAGAGIGIVVGPWIGAALERWMRGDDSDPYASTADGAFVGAAVGAVALGLMGAALTGMRPTRVGARIATLFAVPEKFHLDPETILKRVGSVGLTKREFFELPVEYQVTHRGERLRAVASTDRGLDAKTRAALIDELKKRNATQAEVREAVDAQVAKDRKAHFLAAARKFVPTHIPAENWDQFVTDTLSNAKIAGFNESEAHSILRGSLTYMFTPYTTRVNPAYVDLFAMAREASSPLGSAKSIEEFRKIVTTATVMSGVDEPIASFVRAATGEDMGRSLHPTAQLYKDVMAVAAKQDTSLRGGSDVELTNRSLFSSILRPPEQFRTLGERMLREGDDDGNGVLRLFHALMSATERIRVEYEDYTGRIVKLFHGMPRDKRLRVREILEKPSVAEDVKLGDPALYRTATEFRAILDEVAAKLGLDPGQRIEHYFPWIYSQRTIAELKRTGRIPNDTFIPLGSGIPEYKVFKNLMRRYTTRPLGEILEDPLEAGMIYVYGGVRKLHLDPIAGVYDGAFFRDLAGRKPFIASDMARWYLDIFGLPSWGYVQFASFLKGIGMRVDSVGAWLGLNTKDFWQEAMERYFTGQGAVARFTQVARSFEYYTKLGGNLISPLVNLGQLVTNTGADMGFGSMFIGGGGFLAQTAASSALAKVEDKFPRLSPFIHPWAQGNAKLRMARSIGVYSDSSRRMMDKVSEIIVRERGPRAGTILGGAALGGAAGFIANPEDSPVSDSAAAFIGAGAGAAFATGAPILFRRMLRAPVHAATMPFQIAEAINRGVTAGAAIREAGRGRALLEGTLTRGAARRGNFIESTLVGAGAGAIAGGALGHEVGEEDALNTDDMLTGAIAGAAIGAGMGIVGRPREELAAARLRWIDENSRFIPALRERLFELGPVSLEDAERWYVRQALDMTQFRFGREARAAGLRTPVGELAGALQSFTLNQMEFFGSRLQSFYQSIAAASEGGGAAGLARAAASGKYDMRIWRHIMLLAGAGGAMHALSAGLFDTDRGVDYWISRVGLGFMPLLNYNEDASAWQLNSIGDHLVGPFIKDVQTGANFVWKMLSDPKAMEAYDQQIDSLARRLFTVFSQAENAPDTLATGMETLGGALHSSTLEGWADLVRSQQERATTAAYPGTYVRSRLEQ